MHLLSMIVAAALANAEPVAEAPPARTDHGAVQTFFGDNEPALTVSSGVHTIRFKEVSRHPLVWESTRFVDGRLIEGATRRWEFALTHAAINPEGDYAVAGESSDNDLAERLRFAGVAYEPDDAEMRRNFELPPRGPDALNWEHAIERHHELHQWSNPVQYFPEVEGFALVESGQVLIIALANEAWRTEGQWIEVRAVATDSGVPMFPPLTVRPPGYVYGVSVHALPHLRAFGLAMWTRDRGMGGECKVDRISAWVIDQRGEVVWTQSSERPIPESETPDSPRREIDQIVEWNSRAESPHQAACTIEVDGEPIWRFRVREWDGKAVVEPR